MANMNMTGKGFQSSNVEGLGTTTYLALNTGVHTVRVRSTMIPISGLIITINHSASPTATSPSVSVTAQTLALESKFYATSGDTITVVLTSAGGNNDITPNEVKSIVTITSL
jgi:hypothetical protein